MIACFCCLGRVVSLFSKNEVCWQSNVSFFSVWIGLDLERAPEGPKGQKNNNHKQQHLKSPEDWFIVTPKTRPYPKHKQPEQR